MSQRFEKIVILSLLLSTILQTYGWGKYDFSFIITSVLSIIFLVRNRFKSTLPKILLYYFLYRLLIHEMSASDMLSMIPLGILKSLFAFIMFFGITNYKFFIKSYRIIAVVCIVFFFFQEGMYAFWGYRMSGIIEQLPLSLTVDDVNSYYEKVVEDSRSGSFFSESAHFVQFLLPLLCLELFSERKNYFLIIIIALALLLTISGNAVLGLFVIGLMYLYSIWKKYSVRKSIVFISLTIMIILIFGGLVVNSKIGQEFMDRSNQLSSSSIETKGSGHSGFIRIYRGFGVYSEYGTIQKIFGNDDEKYFISKRNQSDVSVFFKENDTYINTFQSFLIFTGLIGVVFFLLIFLKFWKCTNITGKSVLMVFYAISFLSGLYLTDTMALYLLIPWMLREKNNYKLTKKSI